MSELVTLAIKLPRETPVTPEAAQTFLAALTQINPTSFWQKLGGAKSKSIALEIALFVESVNI